MLQCWPAEVGLWCNKAMWRLNENYGPVCADRSKSLKNSINKGGVARYIYFETRQRAYSTMEALDITRYLEDGIDAPHSRELAAKVADAFHQTGMLVIRDPRVPAADNENFLDLMERCGTRRPSSTTATLPRRYFSQPTACLMQDARPQLSYQVGSTPEGVERPRVLNDDTLLKDIHNLQEDAKVCRLQPKQDNSRYMYVVVTGSSIGVLPTIYILDVHEFV